MYRFTLGLVMLAFLVAAPIHNVNAQSLDGLQVSLFNNAMVEELGSISLNETFAVYNPTASAISLPPLTLNLPAEYNQRIVDVVVSGPVGFSHTVAREGNFVKLRISPSSAYQVSANTNITIAIRIATSMTAEMYEFGRYRAFVALFPTSDIFLQKVTSKLVIARGITFNNFTEGFTRGEFGDFEAADGVKGNLTNTDMQAGYIYFDPRPDIALFTIAEFSEIVRTLSVKTDGKIIVKDSFRVFNKGVSAITSLKIFPVSKEVKDVTILAPDDPPLKRSITLTLINDRIDVLSAYEQPIQYQESKLIQYEYAVGSSSPDGSSLLVEIPTKSPVNAIVRNIAVKVETQNYKVVEGQSSANIAIASAISTGSMIYRLRPAASWASIDVFPVATGLFVVMLFSLVGYSMRGKSAISELEEEIADLVRAYEEKVSLVGTIIGELKVMDIDKLQRKQFENMKRDLGLARSRTGQRVADAKRVILQKIPDMQKVLNELSNMDASFERVVQQYLQAYEQHLAKRTTREVFRSMTAKLEKDLNARTTDLVALLTKVSSKEGGPE